MGRHSFTMLPVQTMACLLLVLMCATGALSQNAQDAEEPVTRDFGQGLLNSIVSFVTNPGGSLPLGDVADNKTKEESIVSCGGMSTSRKTVWQNIDYPKKNSLPGFCTLNLLPPAGTCALRIHFDDLDLRPAEDNRYYYYSCPTTSPYFKATTPDELTAIYCHTMNGYEGILPVLDTTEPTILLLQLDSTARFKFKVSATAVNCKDIKTYESPSDCGIKNQDLATLRLELFGESEAGASARSIEGTSIEKSNISMSDYRRVSPLTGILSAITADKISKPNGNRVKKKQTMIVNEWPWIVYIEKTIDSIYGSKSVESCNGLLLDNSKVLTSRSCVLKYKSVPIKRPFGVDDIRVRIGDHDLISTTEAKSKNVKVSKVTLPLINEMIDQKDNFAILHLKEEVELLDNVRPICLPLPDNSFKDSGVVAGWNIRYEGTAEGSLPSEAKYTLLNYTLCKETLDYYVYFEGIDAVDVVCAKKSKSSGCYYEEGSALIQRGPRGAYYVTGVASGNIQKCGNKIPNIFSKLEADNQFLNIALA